jgi:hypothetical protein
MSKVLASIGTGPQEVLLRIARRTFIPYAHRHGFALCTLTEAPSHGRPPAWAKIVLLRQLVQEHELVVWIDADAMIVDGSVDIATALPDDRLMALHTHTTAGGTMPNTGVWVLRGGDETVQLLDEIWGQDDLIGHRWWENAALCRLLGYSLDPIVLQDPTALLTTQTAQLDKSWNSIPDDPAPHPRIRHYPGYAVRTRRALMLRDLAVLKVNAITRSH